MPTLPGFEPVEFLVNRKFPDSPAVRTPEKFFSLPNDEYKENESKKIRDYKNELRSMPQEEFQQLFEAEQEKLREELVDKETVEEQIPFFDHWSRAIYWRLRGVDCIVIWEES